MKFPRRTLPDPEVNLTPLIDVVFLLLIFFMVSTTFTRETRLTVDLPEAEAAAAEGLSDPVEVTVSQGGRYSVNNQVLDSNDTRTLGAALISAAQGDRRRAVLLVADSEASHQAVVTAMDAIGQAGFSRLSIATRQPTNDDNSTGAASGSVEQE